MNDYDKRVAELGKIPLVAALAYSENQNQLVALVNTALEGRDDLTRLIGDGPIRTMHDNHRNHASFMANVFLLNDFALLASFVPWVYRACHNHGFAYDYFPVALRAWMSAVERTLHPDVTKDILAVYQAMIDLHETAINLSKTPAVSMIEVSQRWRELQGEILDALLTGDHVHCFRLSKQRVQTYEDMEEFYLQVIQPCMYEVGVMWENGEISVAKEHLASAVVARLMSALFVSNHQPEIRRGKALITAAPNEFHEVGAWMVANCLEANGWDVRYLGANTPAQPVLALIEGFQPDVVGISVGMPFNIEGVRAMTHALKNDPRYANPRVMLGGLAFRHMSGLVKVLGADAHGEDCRQAVDLANAWWEAR